MSSIKEINVPDIGAGNGQIIEIAVKPGDKINADDTLITLESEKASMDIPSPSSGTVKEVKVKVGDKVSTGTLIITLQTDEAEVKAAPQQAVEISAVKAVAEKAAPSPKKEPVLGPVMTTEGNVHAGPGVRRFARELGVDLTLIRGTGPKGRTLKEDVQTFVKSALARGANGQGSGTGLPSPPVVDFAQFGEIESKSLSRIKKLTAINLSRNWLLVPHVTQFDEADITELEAFRKSHQEKANEKGVKLTLLVFLMKAVVAALKAFPTFNASLDSSGEQLILKKYFHIGVAVDTPEGLVVPVIRDVDKKSLFEIAGELSQLSTSARNKTLTPAQMQGSCFTISSLGGIGGTAFTPIVNLPDVAILGVSKAAMKPLYQEGEFVPRLMLPLSLSYDHRVIDGAEGARFVVHLSGLLADIRGLLL